MESMLNILRALTVIAIVAVGPIYPASAWPLEPPTPKQAYSVALEAQTAGDFLAMVGALRTAANAGYLPAQELLGTVLLQGPDLFGPAFWRDACEARVCFKRAAEQGGDIGRMHLSLLNRQRRLGYEAHCA